jgi:hypothetical protein
MGDARPGQVAEVKDLARELTKVFELKGPPGGPERALRLFQEAVEREETTAELARRVLGYLFRVCHDKCLLFE